MIQKTNPSLLYISPDGKKSFVQQGVVTECLYKEWRNKLNHYMFYSPNALRRLKPDNTLYPLYIYENISEQDVNDQTYHNHRDVEFVLNYVLYKRYYSDPPPLS